MSGPYTVAPIDPVPISLPDEDEEERRRREAEELLGDLPELAAIEVPPPPGQPPASLRPAVDEAQRVGDAYRAAGGQPAPSSERVAPSRGHAGHHSVLQFNRPPVEQGAPSPQPATSAATSMGAGSALSRPGSPAAPSGAARALSHPARAQQPPAPEGAPQTQPQPDPRARLMAALQAKHGGAQPPQQREAVDHTGADVADAVRRPFHAIGAALRAAAGQSPGRFRSLGEQSRAREAQQQQLDMRAMQEASRQRQAERSGELRERALESQIEDREARREDAQQRTSSLDAYRQRMADIRERESAGLIDQRQARAEQLRTAIEYQQARRDPESDVSRRAREEYAQEVAMLPERVRQYVSRASTDDMNAEEIEHLRRRLDRFGVRDIRRGGSGGGGGGAQPPASFQGGAEAWRQMTRGQRGAWILDHEGGGGDEEQSGTEIIPGVRSPLDLPASEATRMRDGLAEAGASAANLRRIGEVAERYGGASARISPEARAELAPSLTVGRGMVANLGNTGIINPSEVDTINSALPNPADLEQMTFGTFQRRMQAWQNLLEDKVRAHLSFRGIDDAGINRVLRVLRTGSFSGSGGGQQGGGEQPRSGMVRVTRPDGTSGEIPANLADRARQRGWTVHSGS